MSRLAVLLLAFSCSLAFGQYGSIRDQQTQSGKPIPNHNVPKPPKAGGAQSSDQPAATFKVNVKLVNVFTTVVDQQGVPVANLTQNDFNVLEDGNPEKIALFQKESELPLSIVIAIDASGRRTPREGSRTTSFGRRMH
jgi:hypothetical protein